jgi:hypothetical protein
MTMAGVVRGLTGLRRGEMTCRPSIKVINSSCSPFTEILVHGGWWKIWFRSGGALIYLSLHLNNGHLLGRVASCRSTEHCHHPLDLFTHS